MTDIEIFDDMARRTSFLELVAVGTPELNAGIEVGWTPRQTRRNCQDPAFRELIDFAREQADGDIEHTLHELAKNGSLGAIQMWLFNRQPGRWKDVKRIEVRNEHAVQISVVNSVKQGALELLDEQGVERLQLLAGAAIEAAATDDI